MEGYDNPAADVEVNTISATIEEAPVKGDSPEGEQMSFNS